MRDKKLLVTNDTFEQCKISKEFFTQNILWKYDNIRYLENIDTHKEISIITLKHKHNIKVGK